VKAVGRIALIALLATWALYVASGTAPKPGDGDPAYYAYASRSLRAGEGLRNRLDAPPATERLIGPNGGVFATWPPGYPMMLALFDDTRLGSITINAVSFFAAIMATWMLVKVHVRSPLLKIGVIVAVCFGSPFIYVFQDPLTEAPFVACSLVWLVVARETRRPGALLALSVLTTALVMLRYMGIIFIPLGFMSVILQRRAVLPGIVYSLLPALVSAAWFARNYAAYGRITGHSQAGVYGVQDALFASGNTLFSWLIQIAFYLLVTGLIGGGIRWAYSRLFATASLQ
jgi:hypothetical protein